MWYGKGAIPEEKLAAVEYARRLAVAPESIVELSEGENDDDEMFWMMLGDREYAQADYWKWRVSLQDTSARIFKLEDRTQPVVCCLSDVRNLCMLISVICRLFTLSTI